MEEFVPTENNLSADPFQRAHLGQTCRDEKQGRVQDREVPPSRRTPPCESQMPQAVRAGGHPLRRKVPPEKKVGIVCVEALNVRILPRTTVMPVARSTEDSPTMETLPIVCTHLQVAVPADIGLTGRLLVFWFGMIVG